MLLAWSVVIYMEQTSVGGDQENLREGKGREEGGGGGQVGKVNASIQ